MGFVRPCLLALSKDWQSSGWLISPDTDLNAWRWFSFLSRKHNSQLPVPAEMALAFSHLQTSLTCHLQQALDRPPHCNGNTVLSKTLSLKGACLLFPASGCLVGMWHLPGGLWLRWELDELIQKCHLYPGCCFSCSYIFSWGFSMHAVFFSTSRLT